MMNWMSREGAKDDLVVGSATDFAGKIYNFKGALVLKKLQSSKGGSGLPVIGFRIPDLGSSSKGNCSSGLKKLKCEGFSVLSRKGLVSFSMEDDNTSSDVESQDADYSYIPLLSDEVALRILARVPRVQYPELCFISKRYLSLVRSEELYKIRRDIGMSEPSIYLLTNNEHKWWALDPGTWSRRNLPHLPADQCFMAGDKESLCVRTHLLISGMELGGLTIWRYELATDRWYKGCSMITPRCLFASANCGDFACAAGGIGPRMEILNSAEKYNPENKSWELLPNMNIRRKLCSGCYMDNKFYVIGGQNDVVEDGKTQVRDLTCGEFYDANRNTWELIPDMIKDASTTTYRSPPLLAVVNNELYALEASSNQLKVYVKRSNSWKDLGKVPIRADQNRGWGVAFKSLGDRILLIGGDLDAAANSCGHGITIYTCYPDPDAQISKWQFLGTAVHCMNPFVFNCAVMIA